MSTNHPHPSLPTRPSPSTASDSIPFPLPPPNLFAPPAEASSSSPSAPPCAICSNSSKYTCPACSRSTCSATCSKTHKSQFQCTGERDPSKYVDLKNYGQQTWGDDFRYLEESRRKILGWGEALPRDSIAPVGSSGPATLGARGGGRGGTRGGRGGAPGGVGHLSNSERRVMGWKREMQRRGVWVETMPEGMSRRKLNTSGWNPKTQAIHLTVHLSIPSDLLDPPPTSSPTLVQYPRALFSSSSAPSATLASLLPPSFPASSLGSVVFLLPFHPSPTRPTPPMTRSPRPKLFFPPLDPALPLDQVLRGTAFIEFPVIQIMRNHMWIVLKAKGEMGVVPLADVGPYVPPAARSAPGKQLVQEVSANGTAEGEANARAAMGGLADYASDEDFDVEEDMPEDGDDGLVGEHEEDEESVAGLVGAIEIPGGPEMMQKVSEALLADFGEVIDEDEGDEMEMAEVETRREPPSQ